METFVVEKEEGADTIIVQYCIKINDFDDSSSESSKLILGTSFWQLFYISIDYEEERIGFAQNISVNAQLNNIGCPFAPLCLGDQIYRPSSNTCEDPSCSSYFFQILDQTSLTCQLVSSPPLLLFIFLIFIYFSCSQLIFISFHFILF